LYALTLKQEDIKIAMIVTIDHGYLPLSSDEEREFIGVPLVLAEGKPLLILHRSIIPQYLYYPAYSGL